jgi:tetratricopeptide (TPR) repeat protein
MIIRWVVFLFLAFGALVEAPGQSLKSWLEAADSAFVKKDYYAALRYYEVALYYDSTRLDVWHRFGESAFGFQAYPHALSAFSRVMNSSESVKYPAASLKSAQAHEFMGNYDAAEKLYHQFLSTCPPSNPADIAAAEKGLTDITFAREVMTQEGIIGIKNLGLAVNTPLSDIGAIYRDDTLYYTSFLVINPKDQNRPPRPLHRIMTSVNGAPGKELPAYINEPGKHVAHTAFSGDYSRMYYSICEYVSTTDIRCDLYFRKRSGESWGPATALGINLPGFTSNSPAIGIPAGSDKEVLYFVSDRPGGRGQLDLWYAEILPDGNCFIAQNLAALNTAGNENSPFYRQDVHGLYFSSDGYPGLGGYDIYRAYRNENGTWEKAEHTGLPFNSSYHDVYFSTDAKGEKVLLSSNRPGAILMDVEKEVCCYDIWEFELAPRGRLEIFTFNSLTGAPLDSARIAVYKISKNGGREFVDSISRSSGHYFHFELEPAQQYEIQGARNGFYGVSQVVTLSDGSISDTVKLYLQPIRRDLEVASFRSTDLRPLEGVLVELFEIGQDGTAKFLTSQTNPGGNSTLFSIAQDTIFLIKASRPGYFPVTVKIDMRDSTLKNKPLVRKEVFLQPTEVVLDISTLRFSDRVPIAGAKLYIAELKPDGTEAPYGDTLQAIGNKRSVTVAAGKKYIIRGQHPAYFPAMGVIDLRDPASVFSDTIDFELLFDQLLEVRTFDAETKAPLHSVRITISELSRTGRFAEQVQENTKGNDFRFPVLPGRSFRLSAERSNYYSAVDTIAIPKDPNQRLEPVMVYLRQKNVNELLPLALYFDNDHPNPRSDLSTTDLDYTQTFDRFYSRKVEFIEEFIRGESLTEDDRFLIEESYENFFEREVRGGYRDLQTFTGKLVEFLQDGNSIEIELRGYASPRATTAYNLTLSRRRAACVRNFFLRYEGGILMEYIRNGKFKIGAIGFGEETPDPIKASDRYDDLKGSVFSTQASIARRVEIVKVKITENSPQ